MIAVVSLLKIISFFIVLNSTKEIITVIKSKKASKEGRLEHFIKCEIDEEVYCLFDIRTMNCYGIIEWLLRL